MQTHRATIILIIKIVHNYSTLYQCFRKVVWGLICLQCFVQLKGICCPFVLSLRTIIDKYSKKISDNMALNAFMNSHTYKMIMYTVISSWLQAPVSLFYHMYMVCIHAALEIHVNNMMSSVISTGWVFKSFRQWGSLCLDEWSVKNTKNHILKPHKQRFS